MQSHSLCTPSAFLCQRNTPLCNSNLDRNILIPSCNFHLYKLLQLYPSLITLCTPVKIIHRTNTCKTSSADNILPTTCSWYKRQTGMRMQEVDSSKNRSNFDKITGRCSGFTRQEEAGSNNTKQKSLHSVSQTT